MPWTIEEYKVPCNMSMERGRIQLRHQHWNLWMVRRYIFYVPLLVSAFGTTVSPLITTLSYGWNWYELPRSSSPFAAMALTTNNQSLGWGVMRRRSYVTTFLPISAMKKTVDRQICNFPRIRAVSSVNGDSGTESWELDGEEELDDPDESLVETLEGDSFEDGVVSFDAETASGPTNESENNGVENDSVRRDTLVAECARWSVAVNNAISALEKKQFSLQKEFTKAEQLESLQARGQYLQSFRHLFTTNVQSTTIQDWDTGEDIVLTLDSNYFSIGDEIDSIFAETKKLKRGKKVVGKLLEQTLAAIESMKEMKCDLDSFVLPLSNDSETSNTDNKLLQYIQGRLVASSQTTNFKPPKSSSDEVDAKGSYTSAEKKSSNVSKPAIGTPSSNIRKVMSPEGCTILVGRNRRGNEHLSLNLAKKNDIWMHAREIPGAHVLVVQRRGGTYATDDCFQFAANLAAFYSDGRSERKVAVSAAEPKHIQKPRGAPLGAVKIREELRVYFGRPDAVPDEFKEARAISGLSDEYRIKNKSKLRTQNRQQVNDQKQETKRKIKEKAEQRSQENDDNFY